MKKIILAITALTILLSFAPLRYPQNAQALVGKWTQANGSVIPIYDEFVRSDDTNGTICATTKTGKPYVCWSEYKGGGYKICISTSDGQNWLAPSGNPTYPNFETVNAAGNCTNPSMIVIEYDDGTTNQDIPLVFFDRYDGVHYKSSYAYLKDNTWEYGDFTHYSNREVRPNVAFGDDDRIYATWCQGVYTSTSLPVVIYSDLSFPIVWKHLDGTPASFMASTIFSKPDLFYNSRLAVFNGKPIVCSEHRENLSSSLDIAVFAWDGANWNGLENPNFTITGNIGFNNYVPKIAVSSSGSPVLCWETDFNSIRKSFFTYWTGTNWVKPGGMAGFADISAQFLSNDPSPNPDMIIGQYGIFHIAVNTSNDDILYMQTDLVSWFNVDNTAGSTRLGIGISKPSLASWNNNYPMIAGDKMIPSDNPAFTMYTPDVSFFVEWGIETGQPPLVKFFFDDDGKTIPAIDGLIYNLRAYVFLPKGYVASDMTAIYSIPENGRLCTNPLVFQDPMFTDKWVWKTSSRDWIPLPIFPNEHSPFWKDVTKIKLSINPVLLKPLRMNIKFFGQNQSGKWMKNILDISFHAQKYIQPPPNSLSFNSRAANIPKYFSMQSIVSNPIGQYIKPTFYLNADPVYGTISSDGNQKANFKIYIIPIGPFIESVTLSSPDESRLGLEINFDDVPVPGRPGVRSTMMTITGTPKTPTGPLSVRIEGITPSMSAASTLSLGNAVFGNKTNSTTATNDPPPSTTVTLYVERAKLVLSKKADRINVQPGSYITYTITIKNVGGATAAGVTLKDVLPEDVDYISSFPQASVAGKTAVWDVGSIPKNKSVIYTIKVRVKDYSMSIGSIISNVAFAEYDGWLTSTATVFVTVRPTETPCPSPQAELKFDTDGQDPQAGMELKGTLKVWDGCNPYKFQLFWGDDTPEAVGYLDKDGAYKITPHTYTASGTYYLTCYVTDKYGKQNVIRKQMVIH